MQLSLSLSLSYYKKIYSSTTDYIVYNNNNVILQYYLLYIFINIDLYIYI